MVPLHLSDVKGLVRDLRPLASGGSTILEIEMIIFADSEIAYSRAFNRGRGTGDLSRSTENR